MNILGPDRPRLSHLPLPSGRIDRVSYFFTSVNGVQIFRYFLGNDNMDSTAQDPNQLNDSELDFEIEPDQFRDALQRLGPQIFNVSPPPVLRSARARTAEARFSERRQKRFARATEANARAARGSPLRRVEF